MSDALQPLPDTYLPEYGAGMPGYQAPIQGFGDRAALALSQGIPQVPTTLAPGQGQGPGWLASLLTGAARGYAGTRGRAISEREKLNQALGQVQHEKNASAIAASKEAMKARTVTADMARDNGWPVEYVGTQIGDLPPELRSAAAKAKPPKASTITMTDVLNSGGVLNMGDVETPWDDPGIKTRVMGKQPKKPLPASMAVLESADKEDLAAMFRRGELDPGMLNLSGRGIAAPILAILAKPGPNGEPPWNQAKAKLQWDAMRALTRNANGPQILSLQRAAQSVQSATGLMEDLNRQLTEAVKHAPIPRSEIPESNKISLALALRGQYGPQALDIARKFDTQIRVIRNEYPVVLSGGYAPQAPQIKDAEEMMSPWYGEGGTQAALDVLKQDAAYKIASINGIGANTPGLQGENPYAGGAAYAPPAPLFPMAPAPGAVAAPGPAPAAAPAPSDIASPVPKIRVRARSGGKEYVGQVPADQVDAWLAKHPSWEKVTSVSAHTRAVR